MLSRTALPTIALVLLATPARAQYYNGYYNSGTSYGTRIGIGVGVALAVALVILLIGWQMRRRRARAFKAAYPVQPYTGSQQQQVQPQYGQNTQQYNNAGAYEMGQTQQQQHPQGQQPYQQAPPGYSNYGSDPNPGSINPETEQPYYPPPTSPPPAATSSTGHYAPPAGPPPPLQTPHDPVNVQNK